MSFGRRQLGFMTFYTLSLVGGPPSSGASMLYISDDQSSRREDEARATVFSDKSEP
jgi:hypothetical protein